MDELRVAGKITIENAKISGIMPAEFTRSGIWLCPDCRYIFPARNTLFAYCTGILRTASCMKTIAAIRKTVSTARIAIEKMPIDELKSWLTQARHAGDDAAEDDHRDAVADAVLGDQLAQPDQEQRARRHRKERRQRHQAHSRP